MGSPEQLALVWREMEQNYLTFILSFYGLQYTFGTPINIACGVANGNATKPLVPHGFRGATVLPNSSPSFYSSSLHNSLSYR